MRGWTKTEERLLIKHFNLGDSDAEIANMLNRSERSVSMKRYKMGFVHKRVASAQAEYFRHRIGELEKRVARLEVLYRKKVAG